VPVAAAAGGQATIPEAAKKACCGAEVIVRMALGGKLIRRWKLAGERGYRTGHRSLRRTHVHASAFSGS